MFATKCTKCTHNKVCKKMDRFYNTKELLNEKTPKFMILKVKCKHFKRNTIINILKYGGKK